MIGKLSKEAPAERSERSDSVFPEVTGDRNELVPGVYSFKSSDSSCAPAYIGSSEAVGAGHEDGGSYRGNNPWNDPFEPSEEPRGSAPGSGEGINAASKPEGSGVAADDLADAF